MAAWLGTEAHWHGVGSIAGRLIVVGDYPGLIAAEKSGEQVQGDVWELPEGEAILEELDRYEGCHLDDPLPHEYCRDVAEIKMADGSNVVCWIYRWTLDTADFAVLHSGDWCQGKCI